MKMGCTPYDHESEEYYKNLLSKKTVVLSSGCRSHRLWQKACLNSYYKMDLFILSAYDNPYRKKGYNFNKEIDSLFPPSDVIQLAHSWVMRHASYYDGGVLWSWIWHYVYGLPIIEELEFEYILVVNDDVIFDKPENFPTLFELIGDNDILPYWEGYRKDNSKFAFGTLLFLIKTSSFREILNIIKRDSILNYKKLGNAETRMHLAIEESGLKIAKIQQPDDARLLPATYNGSWGDIMGAKHIHCEHAHRAWNRLLPLPLEYLDERFLNKPDYLIKEFWKTKKETVIEKYWDLFNITPKYPNFITKKIEKEREIQWKRIK